MCNKIEMLDDFEFICGKYHSIKDMDGKWKTTPEPTKQSTIDAIRMHQKALEGK